MALLSLLFLLIAIFLGFFRHMNTGLLAIGFSLVLGRLNGIPDKEVINGFNYSLFMILLGVTYLFSLAQLNGSLELLAKKVVALAGKHTFMIPIVIYVFSVVLSALGPGTVPTMAIMMVFSMALAAEMGINPAMLSALSVLGASGGGVSPLAATGIIGINLCAGFGLTGIEKQFLMNGILSSTVYGAIVYFLLGGYKLHSDKVISQDDIPPFNKNQIITLIGIGIMVILVLFFGVGVLMHIIIKLGGIKLLSEALASVMTPATSVTIMGITSGIMSWFSSTSGVVMPTLIPTIPEVLGKLGVAGPALELEMATAITMISNTAGISPLSTGGALALAAYSSAANASPQLQHRLFIRMFSISALGVVEYGGVAEIRTRASLATPNDLANRPLQPA